MLRDLLKRYLDLSTASLEFLPNSEMSRGRYDAADFGASSFPSDSAPSPSPSIFLFFCFSSLLLSYSCLCDKSLRDWYYLFCHCCDARQSDLPVIKAFEKANLALYPILGLFLAINMPSEDIGSVARIRKVRSFVGNYLNALLFIRIAL